jgi:hypothetical protein
LLGFVALNCGAGIVDSITFGDPVSENGHGFADSRSGVITGGLAATARRLLAPATTYWEGGRMACVLKVDPVNLNYATIKLWGSEVTKNQLILFCEGRQIGYRHLGDIDILDIGGDGPGFNGRFFYNTFPLPLELTRGKTNLSFQVRSIGPTFAYASEFDKYQKPMTEPTRGIYQLYTHTDGFFLPPAEEKQGTAVVNPPVRPEPREEVLEHLKRRVNDELAREINATRPLNQMQMQFLAKAYHVRWTPAYRNPRAVEQLLKSLDAIFLAYRKHPQIAEADPATWNADWFGLGPSGDVLRLLADQLKPFLDAEIDDGTEKKLTRRAAYSEMLVVCRDWHRKHRRLYTNQSMINDLYGIYLANRGVEIVDPAKALPEEAVWRYLYESVV